MTAVTFASGEARYSRDALTRFVEDLSRLMSPTELRAEVGESALELLRSGQQTYSQADAWKFYRVAYQRQLFELVQKNGVPPVSFDIQSQFDIQDPPIGFDQEPLPLPLVNRPTKIAGFPVDFPLGLPASVLASNAKWIEFYARRGFDILTYKTVRSRERPVHPWPNWVFLKDPKELVFPFEQLFHGEPAYFPHDLATASMANSFGIPSLQPSWWQDDIRQTRKIVREGHQVLIVSIVASANDNEDELIEDFVRTALLAKAAGADIIEANYSCPNTRGERENEVYRSFDISSRISQALQEALSPTPLFVKIGYLPQDQLRQFVYQNARFVDGIVGINTISAEVVDDNETHVFPGETRRAAGISGWAIRARAQEVARNLVALRKPIFNDFGKRLTLLGLGGVLTKQDCLDYLNIGVDGVETCTGAFLNPYIGLETRFNNSELNFRGRLLKEFFGDVLFHPLRNSYVKMDSDNKTVSVEKLA
jgi:dihydroorotate dehydrogenase